MKSLFQSMLFITSIAFAACNGSNGSHDHHNHDHNGHEHHHNMSSEDIPVVKAGMVTDTLFQQHIDVIAHFYTHIQKALANDDAEDASARAKQLVSYMNEYDTVRFAENEQKVYSEYEDKIKEQSNAITATGNIEEQRTSFEALSGVIYQLVKKVGVSEPLYRSYCPMAFDGKGAMWLSETESIANPYFGSSMYSCGSVKEVVKR